MGKINRDILNNYDRYQELVDGDKNSEKKVIHLNQEKKRHPSSREQKANVVHATRTENLELIVESKILDKTSFKFKTRAADLTGEPILRFDSDGASHRNNVPTIPLHEQKIDTPHFHRYDEKGRNIAYKTDALKREKDEKALLNDISLCMAHYCDETNTYHNKEHIEVIQVPHDQIDFDENNENPLDGINYE